ncbi:MAG: energy transducer TonB [Candidatus Marinimicrobia bacterium]|nr:energy transducer TonB [Candidatus Neomarinimicrobiota bacterium]
MDYKKVEVSLRARYRRLVEIGFMFSFLLLITLGLAYPRFREKRIKPSPPKVEINIEKVDITQQFEAPPPPARPSIPVESESDDLLDDVTIDPTTIDMFSEIEPPPPPDQMIEFIPYDEDPVPIGGYQGIKNRAKYPEIAREAGIEGMVIVRAFIDEKGIVRDMKIQKGIPNTGLDEAAMSAIGRTKFKPAKQRDKPVGVWISIPITFKLTAD